MELAKIGIVILSIIPMSIVNYKYDYDKIGKKKEYCGMLYFSTQYWVITEMYKINIMYMFLSTCITIPSVALLYSVPLYLKNKENIKALKDIIEVNLWLFGDFLFVLVVFLIKCPTVLQ